MPWIDAALKIHRYLKYHLFYTLIFSTGLVFFFFGVRTQLSGERTYLFLIWNLFLAWLPYLFALAAHLLFSRRRKINFPVLLLSASWLVFMPNAPYLITDFLHLQPRGSVPLWYDVGFLMTLSITGLFLGLASLGAMHHMVRQLLGQIAGWIFALSAIGLGSLGVYLGRFKRWNSWDVIQNPFEILFDSLRIFRHPLGSADMLGFIFMIAALMLIGYWTITSIRPFQSEDLPVRTR